MLARVKKNDTVVVLSGKDKGKQGLVLAVYPKKDEILVKEVNVATKHVKPTREGQKGGIIKQELPIHISKVMPICPVTKKPCRVRVKTLDSGKRVRVSHRSGESF